MDGVDTPMPTSRVFILNRTKTTMTESVVRYLSIRICKLPMNTFCLWLSQPPDCHNRLFLLWVVFGVSVLYVAWMMFKDFFPQTMTVNMGVDGCGLDTFMSQHGLDGT